MTNEKQSKILKCHQLFCYNRPYIKVTLGKNKKKYVYLCFIHYILFRLKYFRFIFELRGKSSYTYKRLKRKVTYMMEDNKDNKE